MPLGPTYLQSHLESPPFWYMMRPIRGLVPLLWYCWRQCDSVFVSMLIDPTSLSSWVFLVTMVSLHGAQAEQCSGAGSVTLSPCSGLHLNSLLRSTTACALSFTRFCRCSVLPAAQEEVTMSLHPIFLFPAFPWSSWNKHSKSIFRQYSFQQVSFWIYAKRTTRLHLYIISANSQIQRLLSDLLEHCVYTCVIPND